MTIFILLVIFQIKHFLADYPLQGKYMLQKFKEKGWALPLAAHAGVHALFTLIIAGVCWKCAGLIWWFCPIIAIPYALFDFTVHFTMDRIKASPKMMGRWKALSGGEVKGVQEILSSDKETLLTKKSAKELLQNNTYFWWALGFVQMVHHLTHYIIILFLVGTSLI
jgi:hypothetical protein